MNITAIITATAIVAGLGILIGIMLGIAANVLKVSVNEKELKVIELLPGNNCGGCGYAGCNQLAKAIVEGNESASACPVGGPNTAAEIALIVGGETDLVKKVAFVKCGGSSEKTTQKYEYTGNLSCIEANYLPGGGPKGCSHGCLGYGTCVTVCDFDAIKIVDGIAVIDKEKCVACGKCIKICPKKIIEIVTYEPQHIVKCISLDKGKSTKTVCEVGCIACKLCEKACEFDAVKVENNIAKIDPDKCTNCGECAKKCPSKIIVIN